MEATHEISPFKPRGKCWLETFQFTDARSLIPTENRCQAEINRISNARLKKVIFLKWPSGGLSESRPLLDEVSSGKENRREKERRRNGGFSVHSAGLFSEAAAA